MGMCKDNTKIGDINWCKGNSMINRSRTGQVLLCFIQHSVFHPLYKLQ